MNVPQSASPEGRILEFEGETPRVHDPVLAKEGETYYLFSTGCGITIHTSRDLLRWEKQAPAFAQPISWAAETIPGSRFHYWAPDIFFLNGRWHLYYSVSTFGRNHSAIGLAINTTLDSNSSEYNWRDEGIVVVSQPEDNWNAIDSNIVLDANGTPWMSIGSFWSGIKLLQLDAATGKPIENAFLYSVARRPNTPELQGSVEGSFIIRRGTFYYLFVSFDFCCRGILSTYHILVGRASEITGPYFDHEGRNLLAGGGSLILKGSGRWLGPGHNSIYYENGTHWLVYHAYDAEDNGYSKLRMEELVWGHDDWPQASSNF